MEHYQVTLPLSLVIMLIASNVLLLVILVDVEGNYTRVVTPAVIVSFIVCVIAAGALLAETVTTNTFFPGVPAIVFAVCCIIAASKSKWGR